MANKTYRVYTGDELLTLSADKSEPLVEDILFENDYIMIVAPPKMCKTVLSLQLTASLSSGTAFLDTFDIPNPVNVWYFSTEGKDEDLKDRLIRINKKVPVNANNIKLICSAGFMFNTKKGIDDINSLVKDYADSLPKVIVIDSLYAAVKGSLKDDDVVNGFHAVIRQFAERCDAAIVLVHHMRKAGKDVKGNFFQRSDDDTFGSVFLMGAVDHCFWLESWTKDKDCKLDRVLRCDTQRGGNIASDIRIRLNEPDPLHFTIVNKHEKEKANILKLITKNDDGLNVSQLIKKSTLKRSSIYVILKSLLDDEKIVKLGGKIKIYKSI